MGCVVCNNLQPDEETPYRSTSPEALQSSSNDGCPQCTFILNASTHLNLSTPSAPTSTSNFNGESPNSISIHLQPSSTDSTIVWTTAGKESKYIQIYTPLGHPPAWPGVSQGLELSPSPDSDEAFAFIKAQLRQCDANHPKCKIVNPKPPTRLIDVNFSIESLRLVETASLPPITEGESEVPYIALSYCWGTSRTLTTVSSNYQAHNTQGFLISALPQTLQDTIAVTRRLNQRYLWIDALCIIQDDLADWEIESAQMATVYRNAYLTIAAGTAASSDEGFLLGRKHAAGEPGRGNLVYQAPWPLGRKHGHEENSETTILAARILPSFIHAPIHPLSMSRNPLPLDTRGWTLQERALSTRLLRFGTHELSWSCLSVPWNCECGHKEYPSPSILSLRSLEVINSWTSTTGEPDPADPYRDKETQIMHLWQNWDSIVVEYNDRKLTQYLDKLPAVSGMARVFAELTGSRYVAGLWVGNFVRNLCWYLEKSEEEKGVVVKEYIAPSWSWASLGRSCSVKMHNEMLYPDARRFVPRAEVVEVEAVTVGKNPLGRVRDGWVKMRGVLRKGVLTMKEEKPELPIETRYSIMFEGLKTAEVRVCPDTLLEEYETVGEHGEKKRSVRRAREGVKEDEKVSGSEVYLFLLGNFITINPRKMQSISLDFLVLGLSPKKGKTGVYERIGYGYTEPMFTVQIEDYVDLADQDLVTIV